MNRYEMNKVKPFSWSGVSGYNTQNMFIAQCDFPKCWYEGDFVHSVYSDRVPSEKWNEAIKHISVNRNPDGWTNVPKTELKKFASTLFEQEITGVRITRWSNSGGFPLWRIDVYKKGKNSPKNPVSNSGYYEESQWEMDKFGRIYIHREY